MSSISIVGLKKSFDAVQVLKAISVEIPEGQFVSLLGPSGCGKTTLLRCIAGLETPTSGSIFLDQSDVSIVPVEARGIGMVFQNYAVWPHMTVFENVAFPLRMRRSENSADKIQSKVEHILDLVKLNPLSKRFPHELSGGQQQRVAIARALVTSPRALLLDEPLSNLDAMLRDELGTEIRRLQRELKLTTVLVTHDQKEALALSDRIVLLDQGSVLADGSPEELFERPPNSFAAEFLCGGQRMDLDGRADVFLPRKWRQSDLASAAGGRHYRFKVLARIYRGTEYEYTGENSHFSLPIRFILNQRIDLGMEVELTYVSG